VSPPRRAVVGASVAARAIVDASVAARAGVGASHAARAVVDVRAVRGAGRYAALVRRAAREALARLGAAPCELSISLVDDDEMRQLNHRWRGKDRTTDVLAFAQLEGEPAPAAALAEAAEPGQAERLLGDVVLSLPVAVRQAARRGHPLEDELRTLVVHGVLHLLGWDHERSPAEARRMFAKQREIVRALAPVAAPALATVRRPSRRPSRVRSRP
jgi:probable rRNA maturation factor